MKRNIKDGIVFDNTIYLSEENHRRFPVYMRLLQLLTILIGSYCFMDILIHCFNLPVIDSLLIAGIVLSGSSFFLFIIYPAYGLIKVVFIFVVYEGMFHFLYEYIKNGFYLFENAIIERASDYYGFPPFHFVANYTSYSRDITLLLLMILIPMTGIFTLSLLRGRLNWICYLIMIIPVTVSFAMGITPSEIHMIAYILVLLFLTISNGLYKVADYSNNNFNKVQKSMVYRINIRSAYVVCLLSLLLFFIIKLFVPLEKYKNYSRITETKSKIQSFMMDISLNDAYDKFADIKWNVSSNRLTNSGGLNSGELGRVDQVIYDNTEHLYVTAPLKSVLEGIYLKGYVGSVYTGDRWKTHNRKDKEKYEKLMANIPQGKFEPAIGSSILLGHYPYRNFVQMGRIGMTYINANKNYIYAPYFTSFKEKDGIKFDYDLAVRPSKEIKIATYDYHYNLAEMANHDFIKRYYEIFWEKAKIDEAISDYIKYEEQYRSFVYDAYTKLPDKGLERLKTEFSREAIGEEAENLIDAISYIKSYLDRNTRYTLSPGRLPKGKDFVEYFLYENKIGYCTHYASAGALMLRAMGYPARYVEGYAISHSDVHDSTSSYMGQTDRVDNMIEITVKDYNAHAWVEVYFDGFGWIPVEFTTGSGMEDVVDFIADIDRFAQRSTNNVPTPIPTQIPPSPSPTEIPKDEIMPTDDTSPQENHAKKRDGLAKEDDKPTAGFRWYWVLISVLIPTVSLMLYIYYFSKRRKELNGECYSRSTLRLYQKIEGLFITNHLLPKESKYLEDSEEYVIKNCSFISEDEFRECMEIVKRARFGRDTISFMEYITVKHFYLDLYKRIFDSRSGIKKAYFKLISLLKI